MAMRDPESAYARLGLAPAWVRQQQQAQAAQPASELPIAELPAAELPVPESSEQLAYAAYLAFHAAGMQFAPDQQASWRDLLRHQLAGDRLINPAARASFEAHIVQTLTRGWQPGHEGLFEAAIAELGWRDRRALARFGDAGAVLNRAVDDSLWWQPSVPEATPRHVPSSVPDRAPQRQREPMFHRYQVLLLLLVASCLVFGLYASKPTPVIPRDRTSGGPIVESHPGSPRRAASRVEIPDIPVATKELDEIAARILYKPQGKQVSTGTVAYQVFLQEDRAFIGMNKLQSSNDPAFDEAVARAIRESPPFPPHTQTIFKVSYSHKVSVKRVPAKQVGTPSS